MSAGGVGPRPAFPTGAIKKFVLHLRTELTPGRIEIEPQLPGEAGQNHLLEIAIGLAPRQDDPLQNGDTRVAEYELLADFATGAESAAGGTGTEG